MTTTKREPVRLDSAAKRGRYATLPGDTWRCEKREKIGRAAFGLFADIQCWCADQKRDAISHDGLARVMGGDPNARRQLVELIDADYLRPVAGGWAPQSNDIDATWVVMKAHPEIVEKTAKTKRVRRPAKADREIAAATRDVMNAQPETTQQSGENAPADADREPSQPVSERVDDAATRDATRLVTRLVTRDAMNAHPEITQETDPSRARVFPNSQKKKREREEKKLSLLELCERASGLSLRSGPARDVDESGEWPTDRDAPPELEREEPRSAPTAPAQRPAAPEGQGQTRSAQLRVVSTLSAPLDDERIDEESAARASDFGERLRRRFVRRWEELRGAPPPTGGRYVANLGPSVLRTAELQQRDPVELFDEALNKWLARGEVRPIEESAPYACFVQALPALVAKPRPQLAKTEADYEAEERRKAEELRQIVLEAERNNARIRARY